MQCCALTVRFPARALLCDREPCCVCRFDTGVLSCASCWSPQVCESFQIFCSVHNIPFIDNHRVFESSQLCWARRLQPFSQLFWQKLTGGLLRSALRSSGMCKRRRATRSTCTSTSQRTCALLASSHETSRMQSCWAWIRSRLSRALPRQGRRPLSRSSRRPLRRRPSPSRRTAGVMLLRCHSLIPQRVRPVPAPTTCTAAGRARTPASAAAGRRGVCHATVCSAGDQDRHR